MTIKVYKYIALGIIFLLVSCATDYKRWPSGGIEDRIPPEITFSYPMNGSLNQDRDITAKIEFSEYIDRSSTSNAISISPNSAKEKSRILWYDKSVKIEFDDLNPSQTVLIIVNTSLKDLRKNNLRQSFILNFSTGERIDKKKLSGKINGAIIGRSITPVNYSKIKINLYLMENFQGDIEDNIPEYTITPSSDMNYKFTNVSSAVYLPLAFYDSNNDNRIDLNNEYVAFSGSVDLKTQEEDIRDFTLAMNDTVKPYIDDIKIVDKNVLKVKMSEKLYQSEKIINSVMQNDLNLNYRELNDPDDRSVTYIAFDSIDVTKDLKISTSDVEDIYGNKIRNDMKDRQIFLGEEFKPEKIKATTPLKGSVLSDSEIIINFNRLEPDSITCKIISSLDSSVTELDKYIVKYPFRSVISLKTTEIMNGKYKFEVRSGDIILLERDIEIITAEGYGSVSGTISSTGSNVVIIYNNTKNKSHNGYSVLKNQSIYNIKLRPGKYIFAAFSDRDNNLVLSSDIKNRIIEKTVFYSDTVLIRKNWETGNINFNFLN